jgi:hypothetical protein
MFAGIRVRSLRMCVLFVLGCALSSCGEDEANPTTPIPPQPTPTGWYRQDANTAYGPPVGEVRDREQGRRVGVGGICASRSTAGGRGSRPALPPPIGLNAVAFGDTNTGVAVGLGGTSLRTHDGGLTWWRERPRADAATCSTAVTFTSPTHGDHRGLERAHLPVGRRRRHVGAALHRRRLVADVSSRSRSATPTTAPQWATWARSSTPRPAA